MEGEMEGDSQGDFRGDFKQDMEGDLLSSSCQVQVRSRLQLNFNSLELDSEVGRLVIFIIRNKYSTYHKLSQMLE